MAIAVEGAQRTRRAHAALIVDPFVIVGITGVSATALVLAGELTLLSGLVIAALLSGWSSAWSP